LARYTLLARLLGPEQLGLAATLILTAQFFDSISDAGGDRFLIQSRDGEEPAVQKLVQLLSVGRGVFIASALILFAHPIAAFYEAPPLAFGLVLLALSPFIVGFTHMDMRRAQRQNDFRSEGLSLIVAESISLVVTAIAAYVTRDFTAAVYGLITRSALLVVVSHLRANRRYGLAFSRTYAEQLSRFALPLLANGLLLFIGGQSDRVLIGNSLGMAELGHYSAILLLILYPSAMVQRYLTGTHLPVLSASRDDRQGQDKADNALGGQSLLLAVSMAVGFALVAPPLIVLLYGPRFAAPGLLVALIGILQCARFIRIWPTTIALAMGRSGIVLTNNVARLAGLPLAMGAITLGYSLPGVVGGFIVGELLALATAMTMVNYARKRGPFRDASRFMLFVAASVCAVGWAAVIGQFTLLGLGLISAASLGLIVWVIQQERATIVQAFQLGMRVANNLRLKLQRP
jgi:O-antigen/teichoic acid export membrane protein